MRKTIVNNDRIFTDFNVMQYGHEDCRSGHSIGTFVRSNYLIHYIHRGKGLYRAGGREYHLGAGSAFLILPGDVTYYISDESDPWEYSWLEFNGAAAANYLSATPFSSNLIAENNTAAGSAFLKLLETSTQNPYELLSAALAVLGSFVVKRPAGGKMSDEYVKAALNYIHTFCHHPKITVEELGRYVGVDRSYLYRIFKEKVGISPKRYIIEYKLKTAAKLLEETSLSIGQTARSSGFDDKLYFSTAFRSFYGMSPTEYRALKSRKEDK